jgi:superfamily II DNA or RNA helicase
MMEGGFTWNSSGKIINKYQIPTAEPINYREREHYIHPYILGICIGDGNLCTNGINISIPDSEIETSERISSLLKEDYEIHINRSASCPRHRIVRKERSKEGNKYNQEIKRLKLNVHGNDKFIPDEYKIDSINNRIELLRGLMDSDGSIASGNKIRYSTNSEKLANDVCELVTSLGGVARVHLYERERDGVIKKEYTVIIQIKFNPFNLKHKAEKYNPTFKKYCIRKIKSVEYDGNEDAQCIAVDSEDHSYVTSKYHIVTHNTTSAIVAALEDKYQKVLIVCPASVKLTWKKELMQYVDEDDITIVEGRNWKENRFTIINYDILKNFYEIPMETVKQTSLELEGDTITRVTKEKERVSKKKNVIAEAMENSQLYQSRFDLMIIDEAHRLSNTTSGFYKIMSDLVKRSNPKGIYELSGTPITNRPINFYNILKIIGADVAEDWKYYVERYCDGRFFYNRKERDAHCLIYCKKVGKKSWYDLDNDEKKELDEILDKKCKKIWVTDGASNLDELQEIIKPFYLRRDKNDLELKKKTVKVLNYNLTPEERESYSRVWEEYIRENNKATVTSDELEKHRKIVEGIMMRQWLANAMTSRTIDIAQKCINLGHKVVIFCSFDEELNTIKEAFNDKCVVHNGKMLAKRKDKSVEEFQNNPDIKVFIGNIQSAGVGLTLVASRVAIFNSFSWVSGDNLQAEDRIHRLNQKNDVTIYYQVFSDTFYKEMFDKVRGKQEIIDNIIVSERNK